MRRLILAVGLLIAFAGPGFAKSNVVATLPWIGSIASEIGGDRIATTVLVKPNQDPHAVEARPSMILAARKADIIMYNGRDLEIGYLPILIESSRNPRIQAGQPGNLDCSEHVEVIEKQAFADRSMGDVHPLGNPHYHISPTNMVKVAEAMTQALALVDPQNAGFYRTNCNKFQQRLREKIREWNSIAPRGKKFVAYHRFFEYLAKEYDFQIVGYVEEKPGIPPSAAHIERMVGLIRQVKPDAIITTGYYEKKAPGFLSEKTGVKVTILPHDVGSIPQAKDWFNLMDQILKTL